MHTNTTTFLCKRLCHFFFSTRHMPMCNHCHPLPGTNVGRVLLPYQTSINTYFRNCNLLSIADALSTAAAPRPLCRHLLFPSDGCLLGAFPFDFVLEQGGAQPCPALSRSPRSGSSAQSQPCVVWVCRRAMGLLPFLSAVRYLHIPMCFPPPSSKNILLSQAGKTGPPKTAWKQEAVSGDRDVFFEQLFPFWARQRVTKTICK